METLAGRRSHFTHLQFHCYGGEPGKDWSSAAARVMEYVNAHPEVSVRCRPGDVRARHDDHRRRAGGVSAAQEQRPPLDQHRHRAGDRLRHRPADLQGQGRGVGAAVGGRAGAVPPEPGSLAGGALDRPSQWRLVPLLPGADPAADGPHGAGRAAEADQSRSFWRAARWRTGWRGSTRSTRSPSLPGPARRGCSASARKATSASARTRT